MRRMIDDYKICPYCGKDDQPCSEITSLPRAWARDACRKKHKGVPLSEVSSNVMDDMDPDL
jgi:hypothetical protein